jgi:formyltetrahydrofolate deformylase
MWTLQVACPDRPGLVAAVASVVAAHGGNITDSDQHTDPDALTFHQRLRFHLPDGAADRFESDLERLAGELGAVTRLRRPGRTTRMAIFVSRLDHCLYDLLLRHAAGELPCDIPVVVSNHPDLAGVAAHFGVPFRVVPITPATRAEHDATVVGLLEELDIDLVVLARYMQLISPTLVDRYATRMINIHHSFLPAFIGAKPYHQAHERGVKLIGATAHYVTDVLDEGPIIEQDVIRATHRDTVDDLVRKGRDVERAVLGRAVRWHLEDRVLRYGNRTVVFA